MYDFETLAGELLQSRPELSRDELMRRVKEKKQRIGAGYLTDQGALFLVAGELGVSLRKPDASSDMAIKDIYIGSNEVNVVARVLAVYPMTTYKSKKDGTPGKYRRLVLFDGHDMVRLTLWDGAGENLSDMGVVVDAPVRVVNGYVRQGLDGKPTLNVGERGRVETVSDEATTSKLLPIAAASEKLTKVSREREYVAIECLVDSEPRYSEFVRSDGSQGSLFQFGVKGDESNTETRVVIWSPSSRPELKRGQRIVVTNVKTRPSLNGQFEIHGDAGSAVMQGPKAPPMELRVAAKSAAPSGTTLVALDKNGKVWVVEEGDEDQEPAVGDAVAVRPEVQSDGRLRCRSGGSVSVVDGGSLPSLDALTTKLRDAKDESRQIMIEVIALSHGSVEDVNLKDGTTVKKGELTVGDDTGEMKLVAWRELSGKVVGAQPGERLRVVGVTPKTNKVGTRVLQVSNLTVLEKVSEDR